MKTPRAVAERLARKLVNHLPLPIARPMQLRRAPLQPVVRPLAGRMAAVVGRGGLDAHPVAATLEQAGASVRLEPAAEELDIIVHVLPPDAQIEDVTSIYRVLHRRIATLRHHGRILFVVRSEAPLIQDAVRGFVRSLARELGSRAITVNALLGQDVEAAAAVVPYFASDAAAFVTGQSLLVEPGMAPADDVQPQVAVVTGAAQGIGAAITQCLVAHGYRVAILDVESKREAGQQLCSNLGGEPAGVSFHACDIRDPDAIEQALERARTLSPRGSIDVLVNNAGITRDRTFARMQPDEWDAVMRVNLAATVDVIRCAAGRFGPSARVINLASVSGLAGNFGQTNYSLTKGAVIGLTRQLAREMQPQGVFVAALAPGFIDTAMTAKVPRFNREVAMQMTSLAQAGQPEDVAQACAFLVKPQAWPLRGQVLRVDGGMFFGP